MISAACAARVTRAAPVTIVLFSVLGLGGATGAAADVTMTLVQGLGNTEVSLSDINDKGQAVGSGLVEGTGEQHALVWHKGEAMDLGTLGGCWSGAAAVDEGGVHIAGTSDVSSEPCYGAAHAFLWRHGEMIDLGTLGGTNSTANDVNKNGVVVGSAETDDCGPAPWDPSYLICSNHAFRWQDGMEDLGTLGGANSLANVINNRGWIAGASETGVVVTIVVVIPEEWGGGSFTYDALERHATLWADGAIHDLHPASAPAGDSFAAEMSEDGTVAITVFPFDSSQPSQSYLWKNGRFTRARTDFISGMNDKGDLLGAGEQSGGKFGPNVYRRSGSVTELPSPFGVFPPPEMPPMFGGFSVDGLNNRNQAIANGFLFFPDWSSQSGAVVYDYTPDDNGGKKK